MLKVCRAVAVALLAIGAVWFCGGLILFPDAPIRACASGYCGKQGQPRTPEDFGHYRIWQWGLTFGWPAVIFGVWWLFPRSGPSRYDKRNAEVRTTWERHSK
jgi:hypothetical protein